ncbi:MAG: hypothetical protein ACK4K7_11480 [Allosphingosinicella sp.]|uniref:hypothetical protein n=1 Tax=Allosphingosinicella sp. TaxID=2823234 RepID=UPI00392E8942
MTRLRLAARALAAFGIAVALTGAAPPPPPPSGVAADAGPPVAAPRGVPLRPRAEITPYLEVNQVVSAALGDGGDVVTYTALAAGVDGRMQTRRVTVQASYRYERRIEWSGDLPQSDAHSGIVMAAVEAVPNALNLEAGAMATRSGVDGRSVLTPRDPAVTVYSVYGGPTLSTHAGPVAVNASYKLGYVTIDDASLAGIDYGDSVAHSASASVGMAPGELPVGWTVAAGYAREESGELENRFEGKYARADVVVPVGPTLAVTGGVGYEEIQSSQLDVVRTSGGVPVVTPGGRLIPDPTAPRLLAYEQSGIIWDVGVIWRPSPRTELQARGGRRYGGTTVTGSLQHQFVNGDGLGIRVYDGVDTFGRLLISDLSGLQGGFDVNRDPFSGAIGGCVFGEDPGTGVCFDQALQRISGATFRNRGGTIIYSGERGPWTFGVGAGFSHRRYFRPVSGNFATAGPRTDRSFSLNGGIDRALGRSASAGVDVFASWYDSDIGAVDGIFATGITGNYYRAFLLERLQMRAALGLYHSDAGTIDSTVASGLLGLRYSF